MISRKKWDKYETAIGNTREKITLKRNIVFKNSNIMYVCMYVYCLNDI